MAEQDFIISIRTTADTAGIKRTEAELRKLGVQVESVQKAGAATGAGGIGGIGRASIFGASAVGVGLALKNLIEGIGQQQLRITQELDKQLTHLTKLSQKWADTASSARSQADVEKLALSTLTELEAAQKRMNDYQNAGLGFTKEWADTILSVIQLLGGPRLGGMFGKMFEDQAAALAEQVILTRQAAIAAADLALKYKAAFDAEKAKPFNEAVASLTAKIKEAEQAQAEAGTKNIERYTDEGRKVQQYKAQLEEIIDLEEKRKAKSEKSTAETVKDIGGASRQAKAILMNEAAMFRAREAGLGRDADLFEKSAQAFRRGASPQALAEVEKIYKSPDVVAAINRLADLWK